MSEALKNWGEFRPSKTLWFWSSVGVAALTMIVGFSAGGWVTGGTASKQADTVSQHAVAQLAANICVNRFRSAIGADTKLAALKDTDSWKRDSFIEDGGWVTFANMETPVDGAADLCATKLLASGSSSTDNSET